MCFAAALLLRLLLLATTPADAARPVEGEYQVHRVVDGDTLLLTSGVRVRLQGIDTPETVHPDKAVQPFGPEATDYTASFVEQAAGRVTLTFGSERVDRYGRWLAFVWSGDHMLNEQLVEQGLARARLDYRYAGRMKRRLATAQADARQQGRGIWSSAVTSAAL